MRFETIILAAALAGLCGEAHADDCDAAAQAIIERTGATLVQKSPEFGNVILSHPSARAFSITCKNGKPVSVEIAYAGAATPRFFLLAAIATQVLFHVDRRAFVNAGAVCIRDAIADPAGQASQRASRLAIDCSANEDGMEGRLSISGGGGEDAR